MLALQSADYEGSPVPLIYGTICQLDAPGNGPGVPPAFRRVLRPSL